MEATKFIWMNGSFVPWNDAQVHVLTHTLHYGDGVFEGIRAYETQRGGALFRLQEHFDRLEYSAGILGMKLPYSTQQLCDATCELLRRNNLPQGYVRPLAYHGYGVMGLNPRNSPVEVMIACWPWGAYIPVEEADIKVSSYIRIHPRSTVPDAKICGHYVNSILAVLELKGTKYHEALLLDSEGFIAEGPGENFFIIKGQEILTPPLGSVLAGITRATVIEVARDLGLTVTERPLRLAEAFEANEAFFTGTAAEVTPIGTIDDRPIGSGNAGAITLKLKAAYLDAAYGRSPRYEKFLTYLDRC
jgi:branched-chain amino acid aminotransferase